MVESRIGETGLFESTRLRWTCALTNSWSSSINHSLRYLPSPAAAKNSTVLARRGQPTVKRLLITAIIRFKSRILTFPRQVFKSRYDCIFKKVTLMKNFSILNRKKWKIFFCFCKIIKLTCLFWTIWLVSNLDNRASKTEGKGKFNFVQCRFKCTF